MNNKKNKGIALVTGASSGIGKAFAQQLAHRGYDVIIVARRENVLKNLAAALNAETGQKIEVLSADLTNSDDLTKIAKKIEDTPELDIIVNNAGYGLEGPFYKMELQNQLNMVKLNIEAVVSLTYTAVNQMIVRHHGTIINVSSIVSFYPVPFYAVYGGTKAFVNSFSEAISEELIGTGVKIKSICPGLTRTSFQEVAGTNDEIVPSFMWMQAEDVAKYALNNLNDNSVVLVPGLKNRFNKFLTGPISRYSMKKILRVLGKKFFHGKNI